ncbi:MULTISPECIES: sensor histidine kinase [Streptomyces]|uniref:histidine kinase n=2 Tax=Streptomyces TaxID=1883 RepID=A0A2U9PDF4_STRAS|nr:histidine kinase [Streptomyces actuosus]AWT47806.1 two-component sensor histidine kinase [Streptomyces actuosus]MBM4822136.1 two-component sensor histidine kinase [Streptomyces actuosus]
MAAPLPRPHRFDVWLAVCGLLGGVAMWALGLSTSGTGVLPAAWQLLPLAVTAALELLRRTRPQFALVVGTFAVVFDVFTPGNAATLLMYTDLAYAAVLYGTPAAARRIPVTTGLVTLGVTVGFLLWWREPEALLVGLGTGIVSFGPAATGALVRNHRDAAEAARLRAEQTALLAELDRGQAVTAERARVARELHDMVANRLSAIAIHSTAALSLDDADTSRDALKVIRENSVEGLAEMRRLIGILRDSSGDLEPAVAPTLDGLGALVDGARANGLDVEVDAGHGPLPAPVELAAYRIVQESLTNALKHAAPGRVTVSLARRDHCLTVTVTSPFGDRDGPRAPGSGAGLVGMRERAALLGGTFAAGPDGELWTVRAELPLTEGDPA